MAQVVDPTEYVIRTRFDVQSQVPGLTNVTQQITRIEQSIGGLGRSITGNLMAAFGAIGTTLGLGMAVRQVVTLNAEMENAKFGIASLFSVMSMMPMNNALEYSSEVVNRLRKDAAEGVGELQDYVTGFQRILGPGMASGGSVEDLLRLNRMAIAAGAASGQVGGMAYATMDVVQALRRGADDRVTPFVIQALTAAGIGKDAFNAMNQSDRLKALFEGFGRYQEASVAYGATWDARMATFRDNLKDIARYATGDLFAAWSNDLAGANQWLKDNQERIRDIAYTISTKLTGGWTALTGGAAMGLGSIGAGLGGTLVVSRLLGMLGLAGPWGMVASLIVGGITAAITSSMGAFADVRERIGLEVGALVVQLGNLGIAIGNLAAQIGNSEFGQRTGTMAADFVALVTFGIGMTSLVMDNLGLIFEAIGSFFRMGKAGLFGDADSQYAAMLQHESIKQRIDALNPQVDELIRQYLEGPKLLREPGDGSGGSPVTPAPVTNINGPVNIRIQAERLDDPNMVASTFEAIMRRLQEYPTTVGRTRLAPKPL